MQAVFAEPQRSLSADGPCVSSHFLALLLPTTCPRATHTWEGRGEVVGVGGRLWKEQRFAVGAQALVWANCATLVKLLSR